MPARCFQTIAGQIKGGGQQQVVAANSTGQGYGGLDAIARNLDLFGAGEAQVPFDLVPVSYTHLTLPTIYSV